MNRNGSETAQNFFMIFEQWRSAMDKDKICLLPASGLQLIQYIKAVKGAE